MSKQMFLLIKADSNDGDYVHSKNAITQEKLDLIKPVIEAIKNFRPYEAETDGKYISKSKWTHRSNYPVGECYRPDLGEKSARELYGHIPGFNLFDDFAPYSENGIHTIESIEIIYEGEKLL